VKNERETLERLFRECQLPAPNVENEVAFATQRSVHATVNLLPFDLDNVYLRIVA
jgi:hypothetical protein